MRVAQSEIQLHLYGVFLRISSVDAGIWRVESTPFD